MCAFSAVVCDECICVSCIYLYLIVYLLCDCFIIGVFLCDECMCVFCMCLYIRCVYCCVIVVFGACVCDERMCLSLYVCI